MEQVDDSEKLFKKISVAVKPIISDDSELFDNEAILNAIGIIEQCLQAVEREHLMSRNEELEDINTATMKVS